MAPGVYSPYASSGPLLGCLTCAGSLRMAGPGGGKKQGFGLLEYRPAWDDALFLGYPPINTSLVFGHAGHGEQHGGPGLCCGSERAQHVVAA